MTILKLRQHPARCLLLTLALCSIGFRGWSATRDFLPEEDSYVSEQNPNANYGDASFLNTRDGNGTDFIGYMKFDLSALEGHAVSSVTLHVYCSVGAHTLSIHTVDSNAWSEHGLTWNNAPELGPLAASRPVDADAWEAFDLTGMVSASGVHTLAFWSNLSSYRRVASKESSFAPRLTVTFNNESPLFAAPQITGPDAIAYRPFQGTLADSAADPDSDRLYYSLTSGPVWLKIAADGTLSGAPSGSDIGLNTFTIRVEDRNGGADVGSLKITVSPATGRDLFFDDFSQGSGLLGQINGWSENGPEDKEYNLGGSGELLLRDQLADEKGTGPHAGFFDTILADLGEGASLANAGDWIEATIDFDVFGDRDGSDAIANDSAGLRVSLTQDGLTENAGYGVFVGTGNATTHSYREMRNPASAQSTIGNALTGVDITEGAALKTLVFRLLRVDNGIQLSGSLDGHEFDVRTSSNPDPLDNRFDVLALTVATRDHGLRIDNVSVRVPGTSSLWNQYVHARSAGVEPVLPDFSHAGYRLGDAPIPTVDWTVFNVANFGATPGDGLSDKTAIENAIAAAEANGSGIVFFPPGRFRINDSSDPHNQPIDIAGSRIVLRGSGRGAGGTELFAERYMDPTNPSQLWTSPYIIRFKGHGKRTGTTSAVVAASSRESHTLTVADASIFRPGDWIVLHRLDNSQQAVAEAVAPYTPDPAWTSLVSGGVHVEEIHLISSIDGNSITLKDPLHSNVTDSGGWSVILFDALEEVGVEDLAFTGNWHGEFVHHGSFLDDGGWSGLSFSSVVNSWIRNCRFTDWSRAVAINSSAAVSAIDLKIDGNPGHNSLTINRSTHCFVGMIDDTANHHHANGVAGWCSGNVFWKTQYAPTTSFESHASQPRSTLFDGMSGGFLYGRWGGSIGNQPNHLHHLVFWNFNNTGTATSGMYEFMRSDSVYGRIIMPFVVGFHGTAQEFDASQIGWLESNGNPVQPASLYQAQYKLRTGRSFTRLLYDQWTLRQGLRDSESGLSADGDADQRTNLIEYAIGGDPSGTGSNESWQIDLGGAGPPTEVSYVYRRRRNRSARGLSYAIEFSDDLSRPAWTSDGIIEMGAQVIDDDFESVTARVSTVGKTSGFLRLRVILND